MFKKAIFGFGLAMVALGISQRSSAQEIMTVDKVVAVVGSSGILYSDVLDYSEELVKQGRQAGYSADRDAMSQGLEQLLVQKLLYQQALVDSIQISKEHIAEMVDDQINTMIEEAGSISLLEAQAKMPVFDIRRDLISQYEERAYAEGMRTSITSKVKITPGEVEKFYKNLPAENLPEIPEQYVYAQITRFPANMEEAKLRTRERLLGMRERIMNGTKFEVLARMYSEDPGSALRGGEMDPAASSTFVSAFSDAMEKLRPGQISDVIETEYGFHIIEMIGMVGNLYHVRHILLKPEYSAVELSQSDQFLDSLVGRIREGEITFEAAAKEYSDDKFSKNNGGIVSNLELIEYYQGQIPASYATVRHRAENIQPADYNVLRNLTPGEISGAFASQDMRGNPMRKVLKLVEVVPMHKANLREDYLEVEEGALNDKIGMEFEKWLNKKIASMYVRIDPDFHFDDFDNKSWFK